MNYLKTLLMALTLVNIANGGRKNHRLKRLKPEENHLFNENAELEDIEADAQRAIDEANNILREEDPRETINLRSDMKQAEKGTDGHLEFELQKHKGDNDQGNLNSQAEKESYHLFYDVDVSGKNQTIEKASKPKMSLTFEKALPLLEKIAQEIIAEDREQEQTSRNDFPCPIDGKWVSKIGGVKLKLTTLVNGKIAVNTSQTDVPHIGELGGCAWHLSGLVPSRRHGPFALAAICPPQHRIATFIGQCKVCGDIETIFGNWMFSRISRDCNEAMASIDIKADGSSARFTIRDYKPRSSRYEMNSLTVGAFSYTRQTMDINMSCSYCYFQVVQSGQSASSQYCQDYLSRFRY